MHQNFSATNNDSYVSKLEQTGAGKLQHYTTNLTEGTLYITGSAGSSIGLTENGTSRDGLQTLGFHLAGVDIPHPTGHTVNKTTSGTANNATLAITNSSCGLEWVKRTAEVTENSKTVNKEVYVLAFAGCTANGGGTTPPSGGSDDSGSGTTTHFVWKTGRVETYNSGDPSRTYTCPGPGMGNVPIEWMQGRQPWCSGSETVGAVCTAGNCWKCLNQGNTIAMQEYICSAN